MGLLGRTTWNRSNSLSGPILASDEANEGHKVSLLEHWESTLCPSQLASLGSNEILACMLFLLSNPGTQPDLEAFPKY